MNEKKAQGWGLDLMIAVSIFLGALILFYFFSLNYSEAGSEAFEEMLYESEIVSDSLLNVGVPDNWDSTNVETIGLISEGKINNTKWDRFDSLVQSDYARTRSLFRVSRDYFVYFDSDEENGIGMEAVNAENLAKITRVVVHDGKIKTLNIYVWD